MGSNRARKRGPVIISASWSHGFPSRRPFNITKEVTKEVEAMGGKVIAQYSVLGNYDFVNVLEAPDNKTIAKISVELGARGTMEIMTLAVVNF